MINHQTKESAVKIRLTWRFDHLGGKLTQTKLHQVNFRLPFPKNPLLRKNYYKYKESAMQVYLKVPTYNRTY